MSADVMIDVKITRLGKFADLLREVVDDLPTLFGAPVSGAVTRWWQLQGEGWA